MKQNCNQIEGDSGLHRPTGNCKDDVGIKKQDTNGYESSKARKIRHGHNADRHDYGRQAH